MALTLPTGDLQEMIVGALGGANNWLAKIAEYSDIPEGLPVGTATGRYMTDFTTYTVAKGETAIRADGGANSQTTYTTVQKYVPVEFYDYEFAKLNDRTLRKIARKAADAVYTAAGTAVIDALSDLPLTNYHELSDADANQNNFASDNTDGEVGSNARNLEAAVADVLKYASPDTLWIVAHPTAYGNIRAMSRHVTNAPSIVNGVLYWNGTELFSSKASGTAAKWGAAAKPCVFVGSYDGLGFGFGNLGVEPEITRRDNGLLTMQISLSYTYGIHEEAKQLSSVYNYDYTP